MNQEEIRIAQNILKSYNPEQLQESLNEKLEKSIIDEELFAKASEEVDIMKGGKRAVVGEKRTFGGREYIKTYDGWKFHGKGTGSKAQEHIAGSLQHHVQGATGEKKEEFDSEDFVQKLNDEQLMNVINIFSKQDYNTLSSRDKEMIYSLQREYAKRNSSSLGPGGKVTSSKDVSDRPTNIFGSKQFGPKEADLAKEYMKQQAEKTGKRHRILLDSQKNFHVNDGTMPVSGMQEWAAYTPSKDVSDKPKSEVDLEKKLISSGLEVTPAKFMPNKINGDPLPKGTIVVWGGGLHTHDWHETQDNRISTNSILKVLKEQGLENKYTIETEKYNPGSEKGWKVEAQYHYLIPKTNSKEKTPEQIEKEVRETYKQSPLHVQKQKVKEALEQHSKTNSNKEEVGGFSVKDKVAINSDVNLVSLSSLKNQSLEIVGFVNTGLISQPKFLQVKDKDGEIHEINPEYVSKLKEALEKHSSEKKESSFSAVKEWIGDHYTDSQIKSITDQLKEAGVENKELSIPRAESQELQSQAVDKRVNSLLKQLRPGMEHKDLDKYDVRDIVWGLIMSEYKIN